MGENEFLGMGMKFPPQINPATGRFVTTSANELIRQSIYLILSTQLSERPMRPNFGSNMMSLAFLDINVGNINLVIRSVREQILRQEPRIDNLTVDVRQGGNEGTLLFDIGYTIRATNTRDNMVYPFYLNMEPEEEEEETEDYEPETIEEAES